jgi:hypothetical protein
MSVIILDLDNCIADDKWRIPRINWQTDNPLWRYHDYHSLSGFDNAHNHELYINTRHDIVIFTARPIMYQAITQEWLKRHGVGYAMLLMRDMEDHSHSVELKQKQLNALFENTDVKAADIVAAFDDRPDVVQMYRKFGIPAEIRFVHDVCAYTKPKEIENADSGQSDGANAGDLQGARQDLQGELFDDRGNPSGDVPRGHNAQDAGRPQQVASVSDDDDQSYPTR